MMTFGDCSPTWLRRLVPLACAVLLAGCAAASPAPSPAGGTPAHPPSAAPSSGSPVADVQRVDVLQTGFGALLLTVVPVAVIRSAAGASTAELVVVHFSVRRANGQVLGTVDSPSLLVGPGQTTAAAGICIDRCVGTGASAATVTVGRWGPAGDAVSITGAGTYRCGRCGAGTQSGDVTASLSGGALAPSSPIHLTATCTDRGGGLVGGGTTQSIWPGAPNAGLVSVPVILRAPPATCTVYGSPGW